MFSKSKKESHERIFININKQKMDTFSAIFSFFFVWKVYWWVFKLISPQNAIIDIFAIFGVIIIVIPCTVILRAKIVDFLKK